MLRPRRLTGVDDRGRTFLGEAGVGKSSLVRTIAYDAENRGDWVTDQIRIPLGSDPMKRLAGELLNLANRSGLSTRPRKHIKDILTRVSSIAAFGVSLGLREYQEGDEPYVAMTKLLVELGRAAAAQGVMVMVHLDEVQNITDDATLSQVLTALGDALSTQITVAVPGGREIRRHLPLAVYLTGLPEFEDMAHAQQGATFARRFLTNTLRPVTDNDMAAALQGILVDGWEVPDGDGGTSRVYLAPDARDAIIDLSKGEPFLFQLAGAYGWYAGDSDTITREDVLAGWSLVESEAVSHVRRILDRLPTKERQFIEAMAEVDPGERTLSSIAAAAGYASSQQTGAVPQRLDQVRGIIERGKHYAFRHRAIEAYLTSDWPTSGQN
ncbi:MAG TPA: ATP-binding protein [Candidatus Corynebacterium avicola]|uniref:ATP-binding protein n=1 Tax=Candidatus Corynebacterium avicola TaxID=2838527 RepID=A0A9D1RMV3_9CORY|nr:ATP-binding protein [Candidatus Corynebacterium avicola]